MNDTVFSGYGSVPDSWISRAEAISCDQLFAPVQEMLPTRPARILDIGAGSGRDAGWLAAKGHDVTAVEPVARLRQAGMALHPSSVVRWIDDRLPALTALGGQAPFDCIFLIAVWQHLDDDQRELALHRLAALLASGGKIIMSLRHGPGAPSRPVHAVNPDVTVSQAARVGLSLAVEARGSFGST